MVTLKKEYQSQPDAIASYDYPDIAEGTGVVRFYGIIQENSAGVFYVLSNNAITASADCIQATLNQTGNVFAKIIDADCDLSAFNMPKTIKGTANFVIPIVLYGNIANNSHFYAIVKVRKVPLVGAEIEIANVQSQTETEHGAGQTRGHMISMKVAIAQTNFKKGETLRITIEGWGYTTEDGGTGWVQLGCNPQGNSMGTATPVISTQSNYIPFNLDL